MCEDIAITLEFSAGAELLFGNKKKYEVQLCKSKAWTIQTLIAWMRENILTERPDMFIQGDTVRPGILVLVNDTDWELLGEMEYNIKTRDNILFISTLHGG